MLRYGHCSIAIAVVVFPTPKGQSEPHFSDLVDKAMVVVGIQTSLLSDVLAFLLGRYAFERAECLR